MKPKKQPLVKCMPEKSSVPVLLSFVLALFVWAIPAETPNRYWTAFSYPPAFEHLSIGQGLSQSTVNCMLQDQRGFLWFGTEDGLDRYDGTCFKIFRHDSSSAGSLSGNWISCILEDHGGNLWIGTMDGGLNRIDHETNGITNYQVATMPQEQSANSVASLAEDLEGNLWIGTLGNGLYCLMYGFVPPAEPKFRRFMPAENDIYSLSGTSVAALFTDSDGTLWIGFGYHQGLCRLGLDSRTGHYSFDRFPALPSRPDVSPPPDVLSIEEDNQGVLWFGSSEGLYSLGPDRKTFRRYVHDNRDKTSLDGNIIRRVYKDRAQELWIGTDGGGLDKMRPRAKPDEPPRFDHFPSNQKDQNSLTSNAVESIYEDRSGVLWVGTYASGLNKLILNKNLSVGREKRVMVQYRCNPADSSSLSGDVVNGICEDKFGNLWVGTDGTGLNRVIPPASRDDRVRFEHFRADPKKKGALKDDVITCVYLDREKRLWLGCFTGGLVRVDEGDKRGRPVFTHFVHSPDDETSLSTNFVASILEDKAGRLWVGTIDGGLNRFDPLAKKFFHVQRTAGNDSPLIDGCIDYLVEDAFGTLWIGTIEGLARFNPATGETRMYTQENRPGSLSYNDIYCLYVDDAGTLWIGTNGGGLDKTEIPPWNGPGPQFIHYTVDDGLTGNVIHGILADDHNILWLSTSSALCQFNPKQGKARAFFSQTGMQNNEFLRNAFYRSPQGEMFFGGNNGFCIFHPDDITYDSYISKIMITDFQLFNKSVSALEKINNRMVLRRSIGETREITLSPKDYAYSFNFAVPHYVAPEKNSYAYMMEGFDRSWNYVGNRHFITYTSLPPGSYTFRVKGSNCDGVWDEQGVSLKVRVLPPWWRTLWFRTGSVAVLAVVLYLIFRFRVEALRARTRRLERIVAERTQELAEANEALRDQSLTDPLTSLRNRRFLDVCMPENIALVQRQQRDTVAGAVERMKLNIDLLFTMVDLDFFKPINDHYGHHAGDLVLQQMGGVLKKCMRSSDTVVRWGGEEFLIVSRNTARADAQTFPERVRAAVEAHAFDIGENRTIRCTCSLGFSVYPLLANAASQFSWELVIDLADLCLYAAKEKGRNAWVGLVPDMETSRGLRLENLPREASELFACRLLPLISSLNKPEK
jgi:diguanylate cyclase (GGDEF)-like protein